ncbi:MAG: hypothetical protein J5620_00670 [Alphaproteobacteria bacterium]|nr:hypothetical protein [Alphaproteobacteria bacterium]
MEDHGISTEPKSQTKTLFSIPIPGCLMVIILSAVAGIIINECKRSQIRLENDRQKYQQNDNIKPKVAQNTLFIRALPRSR